MRPQKIETVYNLNLDAIGYVIERIINQGGHVDAVVKGDCKMFIIYTVSGNDEE